MIINLKKIEISVLLLHMAIMRKNIKRGFKSNYGQSKGKEMLSSYDIVKDELKTAFEGLEDQPESQVKEVHFNIKQVEMLQSFLNWYSLELELTLDSANNNNKEDREQLSIIKQVQERTKEVLKVYA